MSVRVAFQGERGSFAEEATLDFFDEKEIEIIACATFENLRETLEKNEAQYVVLPIENSLAGEVESVKSFLQSIELQKIAETQRQIRQNLIACENATLETLETVESHKVALAQCTKFFAANPHLKKIESANTALSAKLVIESRDTTRAAIASAKTASIYGGKILLGNIQDTDENYTKFYLLKTV